MSVPNDSATNVAEDLLAKALEGLVKERGVSRAAFKELVRFCVNLYSSGRDSLKYAELNSFKFSHMRYLDRFLTRLINHGYIYARYTGPTRKRLPEPCRRVRSIAKDPWTQDRRKSGAIKMWLIATTRKAELRSLRRKWWGPYIELFFTPLINAIRARLEARGGSA
jgi:hypothetical protein